MIPSRLGKVAVIVCILTSLSFFTIALVIFIREGDWPARYISVAVSILAVMFIAIRRSPARRRLRK
jgi:hypothetical protein